VTMAVAAPVSPAALILAGVVGPGWYALGRLQPPWGPDGDHICTRLYFKWNSCQTPAGHGMSVKLDISNYFNDIFALF